MRRALLRAAVAVLALTPAVVRAQSMAAGAPSGAKVEGPGVALGDRLVLHAGVGAELRYDSNVFYEDSNTTQALALRLTPAFALSTKNSQRMINPDGSPPTPNKVEFRLGAGLDYREWLVSNTGTRPPRQFNVIGNFGLTLFPSGPVTAQIYDTYVRSTQPPYTAVNYNLDRDVNEAGLRLRIKPGGGRLELQLGYGFGIDLWEIPQLSQYNNFYHHATVRLLWKFLPKTSVYIQGEEYAYQYRNPGATFRPDGYPLRIIAGLNGLLTAKLSFDIYGGYANGFYQAGPSPNTGIAGLTLTWRPVALGVGTLAYRHDILNTLLGVYADIDNVQASWSQQIWRFLAYLRVAYQNTRYKGIVATPGAMLQNCVTDMATGQTQCERNDNGFTFNARLDYYAYQNWIVLSLGYDFNLLRSDSQAGVIGSMVGSVPVDFNKSEVYLNVSAFY